MPVDTCCPACQTTYPVADQLLGKTVYCPCGQEIVLPGAASPAIPAVAPTKKPSALGTMLMVLGAVVLTVVLLCAGSVLLLVWSLSDFVNEIRAQLASARLNTGSEQTVT